MRAHGAHHPVTLATLLFALEGGGRELGVRLDATNEALRAAHCVAVLDLARRARAEQLDANPRRARQERVNHEIGGVGIAKPQIHLAVDHGRVQPERRVAARPAVAAALHDLEPAEHRGGEHGRRYLAHAAADALLHFVGDDHRRFDEATLERAWPDALVEAENTARRDQLAVQIARGPGDVRDARPAA